jgi:hypothetical protein
MANSNKRTAQQLIDEAIAENRATAHVLYLLAIVAALVGLGVLVWASIMRQPLLALAGSICTSLLWPAIRLVQQTRKENIALRLLEAPLGRAPTAVAAAMMLEHFFLQMFLNPRPEEAKSKRSISPVQDDSSV